MADLVLVAVRGKNFVVTDPEAAFGSMPEEKKNSLIKFTADDIVVNELIISLSPLLVQVSGRPNLMTIAALKRGLEVLGVEDIEKEIQEARKRFNQAVTRS